MDNQIQKSNVTVQPKTVLTMGILALALCGSGILGIIFGAIARAKAKTFRAQSTEVSGQVTAGSRLGLAGLIIGIIMLIIWIVVIVFYAIGLSKGVVTIQ